MPEDLLAELLGDFLLESEGRVERVEELLLSLPAEDREALEDARAEIARELHTLKGNAGMMGFENVQRLAHELEDGVAALDASAPRVDALLAGLDRCREALAALAPAPASSEPAAGDERAQSDPGEALDASVRVPLAGLDRLTERAAELVGVRHRLGAALAAAREAAPEELRSEMEIAAWRRLERARLAQERVLGALHEEVLALRMIPFQRIFARLRRLAHDEASQSGKRVEVVTRGADTPIDRSLVEVAGDVLGHLVRNAVVHGFEEPEARRAAGKSERGTLLIEAAIRSEVLTVEVMDDGAGIERQALRAAARRAGLEAAAGEDLTTLLFLPGLSTREEVDLGAGRGVGLAVVRDSIRRLGGDVEVASVPGVGTRFALRLPASLSTARAVLVSVDGEQYALPTTPVVETVAAPGRGESFEWRGEERAYVDLGALLGDAAPADAGSRRRFAVVLELEGRSLGVGVDAVGEILEIVVEDLAALARRSPAIGGSTLLGDGRVALILDPHGIFDALAVGAAS